MLMTWDAVLSTLWSQRSCVKILCREKTVFLFSCHVYSPCSLFMPDKHIWIGNDSKYCFMQHSSLDAFFAHANRWNSNEKRGKKCRKGKVGQPDFASTVLCKPDWEVILITSYWCSFFLSASVSLSLVNPTRCRQLFTPERTTGEEGLYMTAWERWQDKQPNAIGDLRILKAQRSFFPTSPICLIATFRSFPATLHLPPGNSGDVAEMQHQHASPHPGFNGSKRRGAERFTYADKRAASCQRSRLKFLGPRMQGVMYDEQVVWV